MERKQPAVMAGLLGGHTVSGNKQTNRQTDKQTNKHLQTNRWTMILHKDLLLWRGSIIRKSLQSPEKNILC